MTSLGVEFLTRNEQFLALTRNLGDALAVVAENLFGPKNLAKSIEREWGFDQSTARNAAKGVVGSVPVTKAVRAQQEKHQNGWALWDALGELIIGEPRHAYEERLLNRIIQERNLAVESLAKARDRRRQMEARARELANLGAGLVHQWPGSVGRKSRSGDHDEG